MKKLITAILFALTFHCLAFGQCSHVKTEVVKGNPNEFGFCVDTLVTSYFYGWESNEAIHVRVSRESNELYAWDYGESCNLKTTEFKLLEFKNGQFNVIESSVQKDTTCMSLRDPLWELYMDTVMRSHRPTKLRVEGNGKLNFGQ